VTSEKSVLRSGQVYKEVLLRDGKQAVLRVPDWHDVDDFSVFINAPPSRAKVRVESSRSEVLVAQPWIYQGDRISILQLSIQSAYELVRPSVD